MSNIYSLWSQAQPESAPQERPPAEPVVRDWTNQEMADLFRAQQLLERAGVALHTDRGLSDEGEPWFIFINAEDEVFIHLCRIDGTCLLDSPNLDAPLRGKSFEALIDAFVRRAAMPQMGANVVPLRPRSSLSVHPAILLTALIWTIYLASDQLSGVAHAAEIEVDGPDEAEAAMLPEPGDGAREPGDVDEAVALLHRIEAEALAASRPAGPAAAPGAPTEAGNVRALAELAGHGGSFHQGAAAAAAVAASLTIVALAQGLQLAPETAPQASHGEAPAAQASAPVAAAEAEHPTVAADAVVAPQPAPGPTAETQVASALPQVDDVQRAPDAAVAAPGDPDLMVAAAPPAQLVPHIVVQGQKAEPEPAPASEVAVVQNSVSLSEPAAFDIQGLLASFKPLATYHVVGTAVLSSSELKQIGDAIVWGDVTVSGELGSIIAPILGAESEAPAEGGGADGAGVLPVSFASFNEAASKFLGFLVSKAQRVEVIAFSNEVILLDTTAFDEPSDTSYALSWAFDDGSIISTVGNLHDYVEFGLA